MDQAIKNFPQQFIYHPEIINKDKLFKREKVIICGMGGSHLAADILKDIRPDLRLSIHRNYGLPAWSITELNKSLVVLSSYSGNTEEVLDSYEKTKEKNLAMAAISVGGRLLEWAARDKIAYIQMPDTGIQPRSALGFSFLSLAALLGLNGLLSEAKNLSAILQPDSLVDTAREVVENIGKKVPVIYAAENNFSLAYNWKIKLNETGKVPAFYNLLPELNHNEMNGFDVKDSIRSLTDNFVFLMIKDEADHERIKTRFSVLEKLYRERDLPVIEINLAGKSRLEKIFSNLLLADWVAFYTAEKYGLEPEQVPMVEEFKKLIK